MFGYITHRDKIFPHILGKNLKIYFSKKNSLTEYEVFNDKVKLKYPNWHNINENNLISRINFFKGVNIFSDRHYYNHLNDKKLFDLILIRIPKHSKKKLIIKVQDEVFIYRVLCNLNDNRIYDKWEKLNFELRIIGKSCIHSKVVRIKVVDSVITLKPGGPYASDPIFIGPGRNNRTIFRITN
jgi:hypothetical protein